MNLREVISHQREFSLSGQAKDIHFRKAQLIKLKNLLKKNEEALYQAIYLDFKKSKFETLMTELALIHHEINLALKNLKKWGRAKMIWPGVANFPSKCYVLPEPYGSVLIIGAWNYPYQLTLVPLISALAAGNNCIVKPSELSSHTSSLMAQIINENFENGYIYVVEGDAKVSQELLTYTFDKIFFTGSTQVGKIVAKAAAENLTPVTLELGGKSPCLVLKDADLKMAAKRISWGKCLNAGQTCIAPDYVLVEREVYEPLLEELKAQFKERVGVNPLESESYVRIINSRNFSRLEQLIDSRHVYSGGKFIASENFIEPTILRDVSFDDQIMKDEIFGPILPVIPFDDINQAIREIKVRPRPLALYVFGSDKKINSRIVREISYGGGCINDVIMHLSNSELPFGGIGSSGMGSYHGEYGFRAFSHYKSIMEKSFWFEPSIKYTPYSKWKRNLIKFFFE